MRNPKGLKYSKVFINKNRLKERPWTLDYKQRRAAILQMFLQAGSPDEISTNQLVEMFRLCPRQIEKDKVVVKKEMAELIGDDIRVRTHCSYKKAHSELQKVGKWKEAAEVMEKWNKWLFNLGVQEKAAEKIELSGAALTASEISKAFEEVENDRRKVESSGVESSGNQNGSGEQFESGREESEQDEQGSDGEFEKGDSEARLYKSGGD